MESRMLTLLTSPWTGDFERFAQSIRQEALLVAPYVARQPLEKLSEILSLKEPPRISILTNLAVDSMLQGSVDVKAIATFCRRNPSANVRHLPGLHAKVYVADDRLAIITSGNLTNSSLNRNYEYGVQITDAYTVKQISQDLRGYGSLGSEVSIDELEQVAGIADELRAKQYDTLQTARQDIRSQFEEQLEIAQESLRHIRARPGETAHAIFARTILYLLRNVSLTTQQIHSSIESIHPDLCDDSIDRVINGVNFGLKWKHTARSAQVFLRRKGLIHLDGGKWSLVQADSDSSQPKDVVLA